MRKRRTVSKLAVQVSLSSKDGGFHAKDISWAPFPKALVAIESFLWGIAASGALVLFVVRGHGLLGLQFSREPSVGPFPRHQDGAERRSRSAVLIQNPGRRRGFEQLEHLRHAAGAGVRRRTDQGHTDTR